DYTKPALQATFTWTPPLSSTLTYHTWGSAPQYMQFADFNGDGITDYLWMPYDSGGAWAIAYGTGSGFALPLSSLGGNWTLFTYLPGTTYQTWGGAPQNMKFGDFNGDGFLDYMWIPANGDGRWVTAYGSSSGLQLPDYNNPTLPRTVGSYYAWGPASQEMQTGDFNGDGKTDYMWMPYGSDGRWLIGFGQTPKYSPDLLVSVTNGLGAVATVNAYKPLTDGSVYSKDHNAVLPAIDIQPPMYVASSSSSSNGIGGTLTTNYKYAGMKADTTGRGLLGFRVLDTTQVESG